MGFNERLIEEVKQHGCLYDLSSPDSRNVVKKNAAWRAISEALCADEALCRRRWKMLRDSYVRRKRREIVDLSPPKEWKYREMLLFLEDVQGYKLKARRDESDEDNEDTQYKFGNSEDPFDEAETSNYSIDEYIRFPANASEAEMPEDQTANARRPHKFLTKSSKKNEKADIKSRFLEMIDKCQEKIESLSPAGLPRTSNSTLLLFQSLGYKVLAADLPPADVDQIEYKVMSLVHEELSKRRQRK